MAPDGNSPPEVTKQGRLWACRAGKILEINRFFPTMIPMLLCLNQYLDGATRKPGLW